MKLISISEKSKEKIKKNIKEYLKRDKVGLIASAMAALVLIFGNSITAKAEKTLAESKIMLEEIRASEEEERKERINEILSQLAEEENALEDDTDKSVDIIRKADILNAVNNVDSETIKVLSKRLSEYYKLVKRNVSKVELLEEAIKEVINEVANDEVSLLDDTANDVEEGITINNFDTATIEDKMAFICEKYNLTDFELKVIISVVYHEAGWYYDDAFKVATVIYNRTKSKENIRYNHYLTNLDGESMYSQVIATSYTKEGRRVQQFDGYLPNEAGYDFESVLNKDSNLVKVNALLDCLILLKLGEDYENPAFPLAPCFSYTSFYGDGRRNHFSKPIAANDVVDNYSYPSEEYNYEFSREDVINMAKEYAISAKKRVK